jgi:hypothetical protein
MHYFHAVDSSRKRDSVFASCLRVSCVLFLSLFLALPGSRAQASQAGSPAAASSLPAAASETGCLSFRLSLMGTENPPTCFMREKALAAAAASRALSPSPETSNSRQGRLVQYTQILC